ncbi:hypothetical protein JIM95_007345 [Corynebacterium sp. CCM 8835]|nr:hypothetical protein [Corynebacterium antarcticum]
MANITMLIEYRNRETHLHAANLGEMIYPFLQTSVLNYRNFMLDWFQEDIADSITWQLLPLGAKAPSEPVQFMRAEPSGSASAEVQNFISDLRRMIDRAEADGADMQRVAAVYDVHLRSIKAVSSADLVVSVSHEGGHIVIKKTDPNQSHPYSASELLQRVNRKRKGRILNSHDHLVLCCKENLRENTHLAWKHKKGLSHTWSGEAVTYMAQHDDAYYDQLRTEYRVYRQNKNKKK